MKARKTRWRSPRPHETFKPQYKAPAQRNHGGNFGAVYLENRDGDQAKYVTGCARRFAAGPFAYRRPYRPFACATACQPFPTDVAASMRGGASLAFLSALAPTGRGPAFHGSRSHIDSQTRRRRVARVGVTGVRGRGERAGMFRRGQSNSYPQVLPFAFFFACPGGPPCGAASSPGPSPPGHGCFCLRSHCDKANSNHRGVSTVGFLRGPRW